MVTTFAGSGTSGSTNGTGTGASFNNPTGLTIDASGNLYVADSGNHLIRKITSAGVVTTLAGTGTSGSSDATGTSASFNNPTGLVIDGSGNLYVADYGNNKIRKIVTSTQVVTTFAGTGTAGLSNNTTGTLATFSGPYDIKLDGSGNLYASDRNNTVIRKIATTSTNAVTTYATSFSSPAALAVGASTTLYVCDYADNSIKKVFSGGGTSTTFAPASTSALYTVSNGAYDENGNVLFTVTDNKIATASGVVGTLANYFASSTNFTYLGTEMAIVPVPGTCRDFYIIYTKSGSGSIIGVALLCTQVSVSSTGIVTIVSNGTLIDFDGGSFISIAVSKLNASTRTLYALKLNALSKYTISSSGISGPTTLTTTTTYAYELELSPDQSTLAWMDISGSPIHTVNANNGTATPIAFSISGSLNCYGLEFSDNSTLFLSVTSTTKVNSGIYKLTTGGTLTQITSGSYGQTQLELGKDGYIYGVYGTLGYGGVLGKINPSGGGAVAAGASNYIYSCANSVPVPGFYRLPDQIDGENYDYFFGIAKLSGAFTMNGAATSPTVAVNTYTCSTITLGNTASAATSYQITIDGTDASGNVIPFGSTGYYHYSPGIVASAPAATFDLKVYNASYLATATGYFRITFFVQNSCGSVTTIGLIQNSTLTTASANFQFNDGNGNTTAPQTTLSLATMGCTGGVSVNGSNSTGYIATYQITVDQVDPSTGALLTANIVNTTPVAPAGGNPANIVAISLNTKSVPKNYFIFNTGTFKITYTVTNACGTTSQIGYFYVDGSCRLGKDDSPSYVQGASYPNPSNGMTTITYHADQERKIKVILTPMQGSNTYTVIDQPAYEGDNQFTFDASSLPAGVYVYQLSDVDNTIQTGKLVVTK